MNAGKVDLLVILGCNPAYDSPADLDFAAGLKEGSEQRPSGAVRRRNFIALRLAYSGSAPLRVLE